MKYLWIDEYLLGKPGVTKDLKKEWNWIRYMIEMCIRDRNTPNNIFFENVL